MFYLTQGLKKIHKQPINDSMLEKLKAHEQLQTYFFPTKLIMLFQQHFKAFKDIIRYVLSTPDFGKWMLKDSAVRLVGYK